MNTNGKTIDTRGITLVGLLFSITLVSVVGVIGFMLFESFLSQTRDAYRTTAQKTLETGFDLYLAKSGVLPDPDQALGITTFQDIPISNVGNVGVGVAKAIHIVEAPMDPKAHKPFMYATDATKRYYQVAMTYEKDDFDAPCIRQAQADTPNLANVEGTYNYPLKIGNVLYSIPSLLTLGTTKLNDSSLFVIDQGNNLPYTFGDEVYTPQKVDEVLRLMTGKAGLTLTGVEISNLSKEEFVQASEIPESLSGVSVRLGMTDKNILEKALFGDDSNDSDKGRTQVCYEQN